MKRVMIILTITLIAVAASIVILLPNQNLPSSCKEKVKGSGICEAFFYGYEFDNSVGKCVEEGAGGCGIETPFETLEECQNICEK